MKRLRIAIEPFLLEKYGPEIHWTWRLLLTMIGWAWEEVPLGTPCDIAFTSDSAYAPEARLWIQANPEAWSRPAGYRLDKIARGNGLPHPIFLEDMTISYPLQQTARQLVCQRDVIFDVFWLTTGQEERYWPKDKHGFFDLTRTAVFREGALRQAPASQIGTWLEKVLCGQGYPPPVPRWPHGKRAAAAVSHDVDYPEIKRWLEPLRIVMRQGWKGVVPAVATLAGQHHHWQFSSWVGMETELQTRSAFYFVSRRGSLLKYAIGIPDPFYDITARPFRQLFAYLLNNGFEIGLQASYRAYQSVEKMAAEKRLLETAIGWPIAGIHHHYWHLNPDDVEETLLMHEQIGLKYDTSLAHDRYIGWRRGLAHPFFPFHQTERRELKTLQIPIVWMDDQLFGMRMHNPGNPLEILHTLADQTAEQGGCLHIDVHEYVFDEALFPGWAQTYRQLWEYILARGDFWFALPAEIAEHWTARYWALVHASHGLDRGMV